MTTVCQKCGVTGFEDCLIYCKSCNTFAEHRYCLDKIPKFTESDVHWLCEKCNVKAPRIDTFDNSSIRRGGKKWAMGNHHRQHSHTDSLQGMKYCNQRGPYIARTSLNVSKSLNDASHCLERDVSNVASVSKESKLSHIEKGDLLSTSEKNGVRLMGKNSKRLGSKITNSGNVKKRKKLIVDDDYDEVAMRHSHHRHSLADLLQQRHNHHQRNVPVGRPSTNVDKSLDHSTHCLEKDVFNVASASKGSKSSDIEWVGLLPTTEKDSVHPIGENSEHLGSEASEGRIKKKRRKLIMDDDYEEDAPSLMPVNDLTKSIPHRNSAQVDSPATSFSSRQDCGDNFAHSDGSLPGSAADCISNFSVSPIACPVWRGYFHICGERYGPIVAHLSNLACKKVCDVAKSLPQVLLFEKFQRLEAWPKNFEYSTPADDCIGLYFFPGDIRAKAALGHLLDDVSKKDHVLKVIVGKAELLVFSSMLLAQRCRLYEGGYYLWGLFRARRAPIPLAHDHHHSRLNDVAGHMEEYQHCSTFSDVPVNHYTSLNSGAEGNENGNVSWGSQVPGCRDTDSLNDVLTAENWDPFLRRETTRLRLPVDDSSSFTNLAGETVANEFNSNVESNFNVEHVGALDASKAACLPLFPLEIEDLGIVTKVRRNDEVDLELGLQPVKERKCEREPMVEEPVVLQFGKEYF